jgi:hypothetical protein
MGKRSCSIPRDSPKLLYRPAQPLFLFFSRGGPLVEKTFFARCKMSFCLSGLFQCIPQQPIMIGALSSYGYVEVWGKVRASQFSKACTAHDFLDTVSAAFDPASRLS